MIREDCRNRGITAILVYLDRAGNGTDIINGRGTIPEGRVGFWCAVLINEVLADTLDECERLVGQVFITRPVIEHVVERADHSVHDGGGFDVARDNHDMQCHVAAEACLLYTSDA